VVWQDPPPDMVMPPGTAVQLVLSAGPAPVTVPDVVGLSQPYAERIVEAAGIKIGSVDIVGGGQEAGVVLATRPPSGHGRPRGTTVDLVVSGGPGGGP
jgi:beta-lactam-binding protein with PASTA domain